MSGDTLRVEGLNADYGRRRVIEGLDLSDIAPGRVTGLIGPNAAGKTTLLRALAGLTPAKGRIRLGSTELSRLDLAGRARFVTYMPQALPPRSGLTVLEANLAALHASPESLADGAPRGEAARRLALDTLARLGIADLALRGLSELSGGQRQLASLAQCLVRAPRVLLLDEPTSALDIRHQHRVMQLVSEIAAERGMIVLVVLHDIALACRWCRRLVVLRKGRIAADGPPEVAITPELLADVYGVAARVERCSRGQVQVIVDGVLEAEPTKGALMAEPADSRLMAEPAGAGRAGSPSRDGAAA
ncbi:ABC transporter ATP-binding protein [Ancylobacter sp. 6x-1]|uniref:ABC transporter ATP-binding protein n=1 Tax=Ancylobacter crimeensis TaxID=2579147 RepID=A0ABT0DDZ9_9HYPH|nr:ABC transporter ATP-binding protein [Ancylobacter crimeensis]MCK0198094.1 ABC transporter ATP-binding protein [Ancylobacter crimeensis]